MKMLSRFSLYGFLKNMQFFEPFLILYFLDLGLSFFQIGILISFRSVCVNIMEIPSGALADLYGRKTSMIVSLMSYIISFVIFALLGRFEFLFLAMLFFSIGEAFRTGTHKAMIFDWLRQNDRLHEKTRIYGYTRSWSKIGSAVSVIISSLIVIFLKEYRLIFLFSIIPYLLGIWNMINYPSYLNAKQAEGKVNIKKIFSHLFGSLKNAIGNRNMRRLIIQNMGFEGIFRVSRDYLQPIIKAQAVLLAGFLVLPEKESTAIIIGIVYFILYLVSASASRNSHKFAEKAKSEKKATILLIFIAFIIVLISSAGVWLNLQIAAIIAFISYYILQNTWRPILVSQYDNFADKDEQATILSLESQAKTIGILILAPICGYLADTAGIHMSLLILAILLIILGIFSINEEKVNSRTES
ncbi:MAG: MFS transporter [bacterium]|nr:MFS transporter [bacterium]